MRATMLKVMSVVLIAAAAPMAQAQDQFHVRQVDAWYARYLGRAAEPFGMQGHVTALCQGTPALVVEAAILASQEYYHRNDCNDATFVAALYRDVLGVNANPQQIHQGVHRLQWSGNRDAFTIEFLQTYRGSVPAAPVAVQSYRQVYVAPAPVYRPIVVPAPAYRPAYGPAYGNGYNRPTPYGPAVSVGVRNPNFGFGVTVR